LIGKHMPKRKKLKPIGKQSVKVAERTRQDILVAALRTFADKGFEGASLRVIAEAAGTTHGLIRHHFGIKEDLWRAVVDFAIGPYAIEHIQVLSEQAEIDPLQLMKLIVRNFILLSAKYPETLKFVHNVCSTKGPRLDYFFERLLPVHRAVDPIFLKLQSEGRLQKFNSDTFFLFVLATGTTPLALSVFTDKLCGGNILTQDGLSQHVDLVLRVLFDT
jgi:TetR/AcrR family transcriptional regulator